MSGYQGRIYVANEYPTFAKTYSLSVKNLDLASNLP